MTIKRLTTLVLLMCLFAGTVRAGDPIMPPMPEPTPVTQPSVIEPVPEPPAQTLAEATLPADLVEIIGSVITNLLAAL
jgi:hypothetical protein